MENQLLDGDMLNNKDGKSLSALLANGYETNSVEYIKKGFEIFKQNIGGFLGFLLLAGILIGIVGNIPYIKPFATLLATPIIAGSYIVSKMISQNEQYSFSNFFDGTKKYVPLVLTALIPAIISMVVILVIAGWDYFKMVYLGAKSDIDLNNMSSAMSYANSLQAYTGKAILAGIISGLISMLFMFSSFFVLFEDFEPLKAIDTSRKVISKKYFNWLGFGLLLVLFNFAGVICLFVGLLVTIPSSICAVYVAYEDVVGLNLKD